VLAGCGRSRHCRNRQRGHITASSLTHDEFVSGVSVLSNNLRKSGVLTKAERLAIQPCATPYILP
jgi:hypothetical protein